MLYSFGRVLRLLIAVAACVFTAYVTVAALRQHSVTATTIATAAPQARSSLVSPTPTIGSAHHATPQTTEAQPTAIPSSTITPASAKPSPVTSQKSSPLASILLRLSDLVPGYRVQFQYQVSYGNRGQYWGNFETSASMHLEGWQGSYDIGFLRSRPFRTINEELSIFSSEDGASKFYLDKASMDRGQPGFEIAAGPVGRTAYHYQLSANFGTMAAIVFQRGRYVVDLSIEPASIYSSLLQISSAIDHRIQGGG